MDLVTRTFRSDDTNALLKGSRAAPSHANCSRPYDRRVIAGELDMVAAVVDAELARFLARSSQIVLPAVRGRWHT